MTTNANRPASSAQVRVAGACTGGPTMVESSPLLPPPCESPICTWFCSMVPFGTVASTTTAKKRVPWAPGGRSGTASVQIVPGGLPLAQDHPAELLAALKTVCSGTVSVSVRPVAVPLPTLP